MATRRQPAIRAGDKAVITKAAADLAEQLNGEQLEELKRLKHENTVLRRRAKAKANATLTRAAERGTNGSTQVRRRAARRNGQVEKVYCKGLNLLGKPCTRAPLIPANWEGPEKITGLYCLDHDPMIETEKRRAFQLTGSTKNKVYRRVTPGELAHEIIQLSPQYFFKPYLASLGLKLDEDGNLTKVGMGLRLYGYSRGGEVVRSPYPDYVGQVQVVEKLLDRVYGKARQAVDLASMNTTVLVNVEMTVDRVKSVAEVLAQAGALPNGNGQVIEGTAVDVPEGEIPMEEP